MTRYRFSLVILIAALPLLGAGCPCGPNPDPEDEPFCALLETLTEAAFGTQDLRPPPPSNSCPESIVCDPPVCIRADDNGGFEIYPSISDRYPEKWYGDQVEVSPPSCQGTNSLHVLATTPEGPSASRSMQVFQVLDYNALVPEARRDEMRRVRAQVAVNGGSRITESDHQFGVRIDAYVGDPDAFPREGDPELIPDSTNAYHRLATADQPFFYDFDRRRAGEPYQTTGASLWLPEGTDFFVVLLEAYENTQNDTDTTEFLFKQMDDVGIAIDAGNTPPLARPDYRRTAQDTPVDIPVLMNDWDQTSYIDSASITITQPPASGFATPQPDGTVRYRPLLGFLGTDTFTYTVADEEGLVSSEALVTVEVVPIDATDYNLNLTKSALLDRSPFDNTASDLASAGDTLTYSIAVTNNGPGPARDIVVEDALPPALSTDSPTYFAEPPVASQGTHDFDQAARAVTWDLGALAPGLQATFTMKLVPNALASGGPYTNTATITQGLGEDTNPGDNADSATIHVNIRPVARADTATTTVNTSIFIDVLANDDDPDGALNAGAIVLPGGQLTDSGMATVWPPGDGTIEYTPFGGFSGTDSFYYVVRDNQGTASDTARVTVFVQ